MKIIMARTDGLLWQFVKIDCISTQRMQPKLCLQIDPVVSFCIAGLSMLKQYNPNYPTDRVNRKKRELQKSKW